MIDRSNPKNSPSFSAGKIYPQPYGELVWLGGRGDPGSNMVMRIGRQPFGVMRPWWYRDVAFDVGIFSCQVAESLDFCCDGFCDNQSCGPMSSELASVRSCLVGDGASILADGYTVNALGKPVEAENPPFIAFYNIL